MITTLFEYKIGTNFNWTDRERIAADKLGKIVGSPVLDLIFHNGKREIRATQYVGIFCLGQRTIEVLPKMYASTKIEDSRQQAVQNLLYMLEYTQQLSIQQYSLASGCKHNLDR
jgi:5-methylcytosine-specific restriction enzyme subunit McrC